MTTPVVPGPPLHAFPAPQAPLQSPLCGGCSKEAGTGRQPGGTQQIFMSEFLRPLTPQPPGLQGGDGHVSACGKLLWVEQKGPDLGILAFQPWLCHWPAVG